MATPNNLENSLIQANAKFINIDEHRKEYTAHFEVLRKMIYDQWWGHETVGKLVNGYILGGSYADNLKVGMPDEFDLVIHLKFPENNKIIVKADPRKPGNVILDMTQVMQILAIQDHNKKVFQLLQKIVNNKQQLLEVKLQAILQSLMTQAVRKMNNQIVVDGLVSPIIYRRCGPAHTIEVKGHYKYSVDFVPAIKLVPAQLVLGPDQRRHFGQTAYWEAIPKPIKPPHPDNVSFRASYSEAEKTLIHGKNNLKNAIRMLKQHRNIKNNMSNLKSYYIKTLFLWELTRQDPNYWRKSVGDLLIEMLTKLADVLNLPSSKGKGKGKLLFFWDPKLDMIADLNSNQRTDLFNCVMNAQYIFRRVDFNLTDDFKNRLHNIFSNGDKDKGGKAKEKSPPAVKPNPKPNEQMKNGEVQNGAKPKVKAEPNQPKKAQPKETKTNPNGNATIADANGQPQPQPKANSNQNCSSKSQPKPK